MKLRELSPELAKKAEIELNEVPERISEDLQIIKDWIVKQPHLNIRTEDQWLIAFLRGCKYSLERTKEKLDMYYTMRTAVPELSSIADPMNPKIQKILKLGTTVILPPSGNPEDPRVILMRPGRIDPEKFSIAEMINTAQLIFCYLMMEDDLSVIAGHRVIVDLENATMGHFSQMTPSFVKKAVMSGQEALPIRQKGTHHINTPPAAETVIGIVRHFMSEKNKSRLLLHNKNMDGLHDYVPKSILPLEYGGDAGPIQDIIDHWKNKIESKRDWFLEEAKYKSDESKRPGKPKTVETLFGIEGSFRQLNVD